MMSIRKTAVFAAALYLVVFSLYPQAALNGTGNDAAVKPPFAGAPSAAVFLRAAGGNSLRWRPDWPLSAPPDMFSLLPGTKASEITLRFETPKADAADTDTSGSGQNTEAGQDSGETPAAFPDTLVAGEQSGRFVRFPIFSEGVFVQGEAEYGASGLRRVRSGDTFDAEMLEQGENTIIRIRVNETYYFIALESAAGRLTETWYSADGVPARVIQSGDDGALTINYNQDGTEAVAEKVFYNSYGAISEIRLAGTVWSALYERRGLPAYRSVQSESGNETWRFQWDEQGFLAALNGTRRAADKPDEYAELRYEYVLDGRGNWIERREIILNNRAGRLFPAPGGVIRRTIRYAETGETP